VFARTNKSKASFLARPPELWRRIEHYVRQARKKQDMSGVRIVGIDETSLRRGHEYVTVVHDLDAKRLLFCTPGRDHQTVQAFTQDLQAHGGEPTAIAHVCMDMSAAYLKGATAYLPNALVSYDRFHVVKPAGEAMDEVRTAEWKTDQARVQEELGHLTPKQRRSILWGMRRNPSGCWTPTQIQAMRWLQRANLKTARAWRLKMALREIFASARAHNQAELAGTELKAWISWARSLSGILCARHYMTSVYRSTYAKQDKDGRHGRDGTAVDSEGVD
jgi:transposase